MSELIGSVEKINSWRGIDSLNDALFLVDYGVLLRWNEMRTLKRNFSDEEQEKIVRHMVSRLCERADSRLSLEILVETLLVWTSYVGSEKYVDAFLAELFSHANWPEVSFVFVEVALTTELVEDSHIAATFSTAVSLVCELGLSIHAYDKLKPGAIPAVRNLLDHIATYLLSVSNFNNSRIRLSLLNYFGVVGDKDMSPFNRVMGRFGHTTLEQLFGLLFNKRTEAVSIQYLLENIPYMFMGNSGSQEIIHETFKNSMLKHPERFSLFLESLNDAMQEDIVHKRSKKAYVQHLGALLKISNDLNHKQLGKNLSLLLVAFKDHSFGQSILDVFLASDDIRPSFRKLIEDLRVASTKDERNKAVQNFAVSKVKRGRRPSFARIDVSTIDQINYLGSSETLKAS